MTGIASQKFAFRFTKARYAGRFGRGKMERVSG